MAKAINAPFKSLAAPLLVGLFILLSAAGYGELAPQIPEGKLLASKPMADTLELGLYGAANATAGEPTLLSVYVMGNEKTRIRSGMILLAAPRGTVQFRHSPPASVHYVPCRQWAADIANEWKQLLVIGPEIRWAYNILPLAHVAFRAGPGKLIDSILAVPKRPSPPPGSPFRDPENYDRVGVAFITDESITNAATLTLIDSVQRDCQGAHGVRAEFPALIKDPSIALRAWVLLNDNSRYVSQELSVHLSSRPQQTTDYSEVTGAPELSSPQEGQKVTGQVDVMGQTKPGLLVAAWIEIYDPQDPELRTTLPPLRRLANDFGEFRIPVTLPMADSGPDGGLVYELHVRTEAPAYRSKQTIRKLNIEPED